MKILLGILLSLLLFSTSRAEELIVQGSSSALDGLALAETDTSRFDTITLQLWGTFDATVAFEVTNDRQNATWQPTACLPPGAASGTSNSQTATAPGVYRCSLGSRYFRVRVSIYNSGKVNITGLLGSSWIGSQALSTPSGGSCPQLSGFILSPTGNPISGTTAFDGTLSPYSVAYGLNTLANASTEVYSTAIGSGTLQSDSTGAQNTALGFEALQSNTTGSENTALGFKALQLNTTSSGGTAVGNLALQTSTGAHNSAVGDQALALNTTGSDNSCLGEFCINSNDTGSFNAALGSFSLFKNTSAGFNSALGAGSLQNNTTGASNTAVGFNSAHNSISAARNTALGTQSGLALNDGTDNTLVGYNVAPTNLIHGARNLVIGVSLDCDTDVADPSDTYRLCGSTPEPWLSGIKTNTAAPTHKLKGSLINTGTTFTLSGGCGSDTPVGGSQAGTFISRTSGSCVTTVTIAGADVATAPHGWSCWANNQTTGNLIRETGSSTTAVTFTGVTVSGDVINFGCLGY